MRYFCLHNIHGLVLCYAHTEVTGIYELHHHLTGYWISDDPLWPLVGFLASTMVIGFIFLISHHRGYRRHRAVYEYRDDGYFLLYKQSTDFYSRQSYVLASFLSAQNIFQVPGNEVTNSQCLASFPIFIPQLTLLALQVMIAVEWGLGMGLVSVTWYDLTY